MSMLYQLPDVLASNHPMDIASLLNEQNSGLTQEHDMRQKEPERQNPVVDLNAVPVPIGGYGNEPSSRRAFVYDKRDHTFGRA